MDEFEDFDVSDQDKDDDLDTGRKPRKLSKEQQIYGIWAEPDEEIKQKNKKKDFYHPSKKSKSLYPNKHLKNKKDGDEFGEWEKHTTGFGSKMLQKMGFTPGTGLGKDSSGITTPVEAMPRFGRGALDSRDFSNSIDIKTDQANLTVNSDNIKNIEKSQVEENKKEVKSWKKSNQSHDFNKRTFEQLFSELNKKSDEKFSKLVAQNSQVVDISTEYELTKVVDFTKSEPRVSFGYDNIIKKDSKKVEIESITDKVDKEFLQSEGFENLWYFQFIHQYDIPELTHNIELIIKMVEKSLVGQLKRLKIKKDVLKSFDEQKKSLINVHDSISSEYHALQVLASNIRNLKDAINHEVEIFEKALIFIDGFEVIYSEQNIEFNIEGLVGYIFYPIMIEILENWDPFSDSHHVIDIFTKWHECIKNITKGRQQFEGNNSLDSNNLYEKIFRDLWIPKFCKSLIEFDMSQFAILLSNITIWRPITSSRSWDMIKKVVLACIISHIDESKFTLDHPLDLWILQYRDYIGDDMNHAYKAVMKWLMKNFLNFDPSDQRYINILKPWKEIFTREQFSAFLKKTVITRIIEYLDTNLQINPKNQIIDPLISFLKWRVIIEDQVLANIISRHFSREWLNILHRWLNAEPNYADVKKWYSGWKSLLNPLINYPSISGVFAQALEMIEQGLNKQPISSPKEYFFSFSEVKTAQKTQKKVSLTFKEIVEATAIDNHLIFTPTTRKRPDGKIIYQFSNSYIYVDRDVIFMENKESQSQRWAPVSLSNLLEISK